METGAFAVKALAAVVLFVTAWGGVMLPWLLDQRSSGGSLSLASMFSAGVMLGAGLLHLLPDAAKQFSGEFPWANLLFIIGLLLPLAIEKLALEHDSTLDGNGLMHRTTRLRKDGDLESSSEEVSEPDSADHLGHHHFHALAMSRRPGPVLVLLAALSFHSVLEGLAQGAAATLAMSAELLVVIMLHKGLAAFALGCVFLKSGLSRRSAILFGLAFALATPLGIAAGLGTSRRPQTLIKPHISLSLLSRTFASPFASSAACRAEGCCRHLNLRRARRWELLLRCSDRGSADGAAGSTCVNQGTAWYHGSRPVSHGRARLICLTKVGNRAPWLAAVTPAVPPDQTHITIISNTT
jgi:solute carrier family 39 (zinc transporter), member 1/2/3